jgi:hypothetical protein
LAALFPESLTLVCREGARETFFSDLSLRAVFEVDMQLSGDGRIFDADALARAVRQCDLLLSLNPWHSTSMDRLLTILKPAQSVGFFSAFQVNLPRDYSKHSADLAFDIPRFLEPSLRLDDFAERPTFPPCYLKQAQRIRAVFPTDLRVMAVHADTRPEKMWSSFRFANLLTAFLSRHPEFVVFVIGPTDPDFVHNVRDSPVFSCSGLPIATAICLVAECGLSIHACCTPQIYSASPASACSDLQAVKSGDLDSGRAGMSAVMDLRKILARERCFKLWRIYSHPISRLLLGNDGRSIRQVP